MRSLISTINKKEIFAQRIFNVYEVESILVEENQLTHQSSIILFPTLPLRLVNFLKFCLKNQ